MKKVPNPIDKHVGSRVRMRRVLLGMSQEKLGEALNLTFQQVQKYEKGTNRIGASRLQQISKTLNVPPAYFFDGAPSFDDNDDKTVHSAAAEAGSAYVVDFLSTTEGLQSQSLPLPASKMPRFASASSIWWQCPGGGRRASRAPCPRVTFCLLPDFRLKDERYDTHPATRTGASSQGGLLFATEKAELDQSAARCRATKTARAFRQLYDLSSPKLFRDNPPYCQTQGSGGRGLAGCLSADLAERRQLLAADLHPARAWMNSDCSEPGDRCFAPKDSRVTTVTGPAKVTSRIGTNALQRTETARLI